MIKDNLLNNWYVITGAPCSGKTTVLKELRKKGFQTVEEAARIYIDQELAKGKKLPQIRKNELIFQKEVLKFKIEIEKKLAKRKTIFLERGIPDSLAYYQICGKINDIFLNKAIENCYYKKVFLFELLDYQKDYARIEDKKRAVKLEQLLEKSYQKIGLPIIKVARMPVKQRLKFVLKNM